MGRATKPLFGRFWFNYSDIGNRADRTYCDSADPFRGAMLSRSPHSQAQKHMQPLWPRYRLKIWFVKLPCSPSP